MSDIPTPFPMDSLAPEEDPRRAKSVGKGTTLHLGRASNNRTKSKG
jgi:hypothetical protein